jgi:hypothetical protein
MTPFGSGPRVIVKVRDGAGFVFKRVRVVRVFPDGSQSAEADDVERFDFEVEAEEE